MSKLTEPTAPAASLVLPPFHVLTIDNFTLTRADLDRWEIRPVGITDPFAVFDNLPAGVRCLLQLVSSKSETLTALLDVFLEAQKEVTRNGQALAAVNWQRLSMH